VVHGRRGGAAAAPRRAGAGHGVQAAQAKLGQAGVGELAERGRAWGSARLRGVGRAWEGGSSGRPWGTSATEEKSPRARSVRGSRSVRPNRDRERKREKGGVEGE